MNRVLSAFSSAVLALAVLGIAAAAKNGSPAITQLFGFPCDAATLTKCPDGSFPHRLIESADGNFYGIAIAGGTGLNAQGTVFKLTRDGAFTLLHSFAELRDGSLPNGAAPTSLVEGMDGFLYGTTEVDGANGVGTAFRMSKSGKITLLHSFCNTIDCSDGAYPTFLTQGIDGNFYGATGPQKPPTSILFSMSPTGDFKTLHTFDTNTQPDGTGVFGMVQLADGNFYGTTVAGNQFTPYNSVFRFNPATGGYTILHGFNSDSNLSNVGSSGLTFASDGNLYGLRVGSILYRITLSGNYHEIHAVSSTQYTDGGLIQASDGNIWGDFFAAPGIVFSCTLSGSVLESLPFDPAVNGSNPLSLFQAADGKLYGLSYQNGAPNGQASNGAFWVIDAGLSPPEPRIINFEPASGKAGSTFLLQGAHFVGTTAVTVGGTSAGFSVLTANYILVTVPSGVSTGTISVTNAGGTSTSANAFTVE